MGSPVLGMTPTPTPAQSLRHPIDPSPPGQASTRPPRPAPMIGTMIVSSPIVTGLANTASPTRVIRTRRPHRRCPRGGAGVRHVRWCLHRGKVSVHNHADEPQPVALNGCGHVFCGSCVLQWIKVSNPLPFLFLVLTISVNAQVSDVTASWRSCPRACLLPTLSICTDSDGYALSTREDHGRNSSGQPPRRGSSSG